MQESHQGGIVSVKFEEPANSNYAAIVCRVPVLVKLENADRLQGVPLFGLQAIVDLNTKVGDLGILFPTEVQLSHEYMFNNNLYSHALKEVGGVVQQLNIDPAAKGYMGDNRRVRAIRLRGNRSDALFMPLTSLNYLGVTPADFKEGDTFDRIGEAEICRKYIVPRNNPGAPGSKNQKAKPSRVDPRLFPEHTETRQFLRVQETLNPNALCVVSQKIHGTSIRIGNIPVKRKLPLRDKIAKKLGAKVQKTEYAMVFGSRKVVKDSTNPDQQHYYDHDLYSAEGAKLTGLVPENYLVFGEVIGWTDGGGEIQRNYSYCLPKGTRKLFVYRVAVVNSQGTLVDLSWDAVKEFCSSIGVEHVPELFRCKVGALTESHDWAAGATMLDELMDVKYRDQYPQSLPLGPEAPCDEGVCIRIEGLNPTIVKAKSPMFLAHETKMLDAEVVDIESDSVTLE